MNEATTLSAFIEGWELFRTPALAGALAGALLGVLGVYVILRRLVFLTAAVSQAAGFGVVLAFYVQIHLGWSATVAHPMLGAALLTILTVAPMASGRLQGNQRIDSLLGFAYLLGAGGALALGTRIVQELHDVQSLLFGSAVAVLPEDFSMMVWVAGALLLLQAWWWRGFSAASFDPAGAQVRGLPVRLLDIVLFASLALAVSLCTRVLGALPAFVFSVLPGLAATRLAPNVGWALIFGGVLGAVCGLGGYLLAFTAQLPVGASQALVGVFMVVLAEALRRLIAAVALSRPVG